MRVAIYSRLSRDSEASTSIERQREACTRLCRERGWEVVLTADDVDVSATKRRLDRPGLDEVRRAYAGIDAVVFWKIDRLARSIGDFVKLMDEADKAGVALVSATEPLDLSTPMGRAVASILGIMAELEAKTTGMRIANTWSHLKTTGRATGGIRLYGYRAVQRADGPGYVMEPDPVEAEVVREVVRRVLAKESLLSIARDLTSRGIQTRRKGGTWRPDTISAVLRNPGLQGYAVHHGKPVTGDDGLPVAFWEAIVRPAQWARLQAELDRRGQSRGERHQGEWLLSGIARCGHCGAKLYAKRNKDRDFYSCSTPSNGGECPGVSVSRTRLEEYVTGEFLDRFGATGMFHVTEAAGTDHADEIAAVEAALAELEADRYERGLFQGPAGATRFTAVYGRLETRLIGLRSVERPGTQEVHWTGRTVRSTWDESDCLASRRDLIKNFLPVVRVTKGTPGKHGLDPNRVELCGRPKGDVTEQIAAYTRALAEVNTTVPRIN